MKKPIRHLKKKQDLNDNQYRTVDETNANCESEKVKEKKVTDCAGLKRSKSYGNLMSDGLKTFHENWDDDLSGL